MKNTKGITLIALIITVIVLLILAGTAISITINQGSLIAKSRSSVEQWNSKVAEENTMLNDYMVYFDDSMAPAIKYGYSSSSNLKLASSLPRMSEINYYYDSSKDPIRCVITGNSNGVIELWPKQKIDEYTLGYDDPAAIAAFTNGAPEGYEDSNSERARWSYNHAIATLNKYAQKYMGSMAASVRCIGADRDNIVLSEDETTNMFTTQGWPMFNNGPQYDGFYKDTVRNYGFYTPMYDYYRSFNAWSAERETSNIGGKNITGTIGYATKESGTFTTKRTGPSTCSVSTLDGNTYSESGGTYTREFLPIIVLKSNIYVDVLFDATNAAW